MSKTTAQSSKKARRVPQRELGEIWLRTETDKPNPFVSETGEGLIGVPVGRSDSVAEGDAEKSTVLRTYKCAVKGPNVGDMRIYDVPGATALQVSICNHCTVLSWQQALHAAGDFLAWATKTREIESGTVVLADGTVTATANERE